LTVLNDLAKSLTTIKDLDEVLAPCRERGPRADQGEASVLWLFEAGVLWPVAWEGIEDRAAEPLRFTLTQNFAERLARERKVSVRHLLAQAGGPHPTAILGTSGQALAVSFVGPRAWWRSWRSAARARASSPPSRSGSCWRTPITRGGR
jgi:hypothetical protein